LNSPHLHTVDYLIVGQGLAGSLLAWELSRRNHKILVVDNGLTSASQIAAGLINPVSGMRLAINPDVEFLLPAAKKFYQELEIFFNQTFLIEKPMRRLLRNQQELQYCKKRLADPNYHPYLSDLKVNFKHQNLQADYGILHQKQTCFLQTKPLLAKIKTYLKQTRQYLKTDLDYSGLKIQANTIQWQNIEATWVIFCEGYQARNNPWFSWLPFNLAKGEILTLASQNCMPDYIINYGLWLIPTNKNIFRSGATFDRENIDTNTTNQAKNTLLREIHQYAPDFSASTVIKHHAHIRPATMDRHPFLGCHPAQPQLCIFNGFGSKGSLLIPWFACYFADYLANSSPLPKQANINRHYEKYYC
jgi:glycine/D-amino acid oxidase-like deaminating enzyme